MVTVSDLLKINVFESYQVVSGSENLGRVVSSVSVLETPEFEKYVIEHSLILTTLYPVKQDLALFNKLLEVLNAKHSSGLVIKIHRYIDDIPNEIIDRANALDFPIIVIDYDANLSTIFNSIISEIQGNEYNKNSTTMLYSNILKAISDTPSTKELVRSVEPIEDLEILIYNPNSKDIYYSNDLIKQYYEMYQHSSSTLVKDGDYLIYLTNIDYQGRFIYRLALLTKKDKRYLLYNYAEIYKMMAIFVYQKKQENFMKQNQFLLSFVSNITAHYNTNDELIEVSRFYDWDVRFPIFLLLFSIKSKNYDQQEVIYTIHRSVLRCFNIDKKSIRYIFMDDLILFLINTSFESHNADLVAKVYDDILEETKDIKLKVAYSNPIDKAHEIPKVFAILSKTINNSNQRMIDISIFNENHVRLMTLLKSLNYEELKEFSAPILGRLLEYEKSTSLPLINTIYKYIQCHFSIRETAEALFIHPNSLKYRLSIAEKLGYKIDSTKTHFFDLYLALYVHINLMDIHDE